MTKKKVGKKTSRRNQTAHLKALADPGVQEILSALRSEWKVLDPQQRSEQLNRLRELNCSDRGMAEELGIPLTTLRRYIGAGTLPESRGASHPEVDCSKPAAAGHRRMPQLEAAIESKKAFQRNRAAALISKKAAQNAEPQSALKTAPTLKIPGPTPIPAKALSIADSIPGSKQTKGEDEVPRMSLIESWQRREIAREEKIRRLLSPAEPRPCRDATSMKRQGRPLPPTDRD